jgi:ABC-type ATPase involved in cell division
MRVNSLQVENLLTFDRFQLDLNGKTNVLVGPNGAGKSNIVRIIDLVCKGMDWAAMTGRGSPFAQAAEQVLKSFAAAHHHGSLPEQPASVRLDVEFTTVDERELLCTFVRAAVLCTLLDELGRDAQTAVTVSAWVDSEITNDRLASLFSGTVVLEHIGMPQHSWGLSYEFRHGDGMYRWLLANRGFMHSIVPASSPQALMASSSHKQLKEVLLGLPQSAQQPITLPSPLPSFDFSSLCPTGSETVTSINIRTGTGSFSTELAPCRRASELLGIPDESRAGQQAFPLAYVLSMLLDNGIITVGEQFRGLGVGGTPPQQAGPYGWEVLVSPMRSRAPWLLPLRLFELKNGSPAQRERFEAVQRKFSELAPGRSMDVKFQAFDLAAVNPATIGTGQVAIFGQGVEQQEPQQPHPGAAVTVVVDRTAEDGRHPNDLPVQLHGGGTWESLVVAEALVESKDRVVILDEPALTLHPTWQRAVRASILEAPGTCLVITHSANLVPVETPDDLSRLVRIEDESGSSRAHRLPSLSPDDAKRITREFRLSTDAVSLLFARGVVLLEGETELGALPEWFDRLRDTGCPAPGELDLAFYSVGGDSNFRTLLTVLHAFAIPWVLVCDGAAFDVTKRVKRLPHIFDQVTAACGDVPELEEFLKTLDPEPSRRVMDVDAFMRQRELGRAHGVFTLARGWTTANKDTGAVNDESFEAFVEVVAPGKLDEARNAVGDSKVRIGLWLGEHEPCPTEVRELYEGIVKALRERGLSYTPSQQSAQ